MRTCSAMPLSAHMLLPNEEFNSGTESAGLNRHIVGDERALQKRRSDSILASSLALLPARVIVEA